MGGIESVLVTGGAGFIGSALVRRLVNETSLRVVTVDILARGRDLSAIDEVMSNPDHHFEQADVADGAAMREILSSHRPDAVVHLAAESHVDRSIESPATFLRTNVLGTHALLEACEQYWRGRADEWREEFRFVHVSTDEVYGSLGEDGMFSEDSCYRPRSPYSASKASSDHFAMAWQHTYGLPVIVTHCSNNVGPFQTPEALVPVVIRKAAARQPVPVYGDGKNVRDWIYVADHVRALVSVLNDGEPGNTYNIGARNERRNIDLVRDVCGLVDEMVGTESGSHAELIEFVEDRPGHDWRYAIDPTKVEQDLGWKPEVDLEEALRRSVRWYLDHLDWCSEFLDQARGEGEHVAEGVT